MRHSKSQYISSTHVFLLENSIFNRRIAAFVLERITLIIIIVPTITIIIIIIIMLIITIVIIPIIINTMNAIFDITLIITGIITDQFTAISLRNYIHTMPGTRRITRYLDIAIPDAEGEDGDAPSLQESGRGSWVAAVAVSVRHQEHGFAGVIAGEGEHTLQQG